MKKLKIILIIFGFGILAFGIFKSFSGPSNFNLSNSIIANNDLIPGGPGKDGIPAVIRPNFVDASEVNNLKKEDLVLAIYVSGEAKAYPLKILNWHEVVNDKVSGLPIAVTWCPLTRSAVVFKRLVNNKIIVFGVSGLLYNSNLVMYDKKTDSLWPQLTEGAVTGSYVTTRLDSIPSIITTWESWKEKHPRTLVLSEDTGYRRDYGKNPYGSYDKSAATIFPVRNIDKRLPPKTLIIGVDIGGTKKAYPMSLLENRRTPIEDTVNKENIKIYGGPMNTAYVTDEDGNIVKATMAYWFAWSAFNRDTLLYR